MEQDIVAARRAFAGALRKRQRIQSDLLVSAFATVPREVFVGPPPWRI